MEGGSKKQKIPECGSWKTGKGRKEVRTPNLCITKYNAILGEVNERQGLGWERELCARHFHFQWKPRRQFLTEA